MSILHLSYSDINGGAARAAYRLHRSLLDHDAISRMKVRSKKSDDWTVNGPQSSFGKINSLFRPALNGLISHLQKTGNKNLHSGNWLPSFWAGGINTQDCEVVNLHWVGDETLSIEDIGRISKPVVWTLHDMWPFCGAEHYTNDDESARWRTGYSKANRPTSERGLDLDRLVWQRKCRAWKRPMQIVAPSRWLADCARESALFRNWPISVIPNPLDTQTYQPLNRHFCRQTLGLPHDRKIILFGTLGGRSDLRKGYDLMLEALERLAHQGNMQNVLCVVFGQSEPEKPPKLHLPIRWVGRVHDDATLVLLYNSADVVVVPSRQENLPQTATEAQACGCPVVAFDCTGFRDAVVHRETGYLARPFDAVDMAEGLGWVLCDANRRDALGNVARARALRLWAPEVVAPQYLAAYRSAIEQVL